MSDEKKVDEKQYDKADYEAMAKLVFATERTVRQLQDDAVSPLIAVMLTTIRSGKFDDQLLKMAETLHHLTASQKRQAEIMGAFATSLHVMSGLASERFAAWLTEETSKPEGSGGSSSGGLGGFSIN
jgi:hypothetical protein